MSVGLLSLAWSAQLIALASPPPESWTHHHDIDLEPPHAESTRPLENKPNPAPMDAGARAFMVRGEPQSGRPAGILSGKTVYVSAGHGWVRTDYGWRTQRGNTNGIVEDFVSIEAVNEYLIPLLHAMGAYVVAVREPDLGTPRVIVDDADATLVGSATEGEPAGIGWGAFPFPITSDADRPFEAADARSLVTSAAGGGELRYALPVPEDNRYNVYVSYVQGPDRAADAHWVVRHSGGETSFRLDQRRHGGTWVLLGRFHFEAGAPVERASVALLDDSETPGAVVSADAVRIGGGDAVHDRGDGVHPGPLFEQASRYYTQYAGAPDSVFDSSSTDGSDDVRARPRFAAWDHEDGEDAVYVAWHTNAPDPGRGTSSFTYGPNAPSSPLSEFSGVTGSLELQQAVHEQLINDLRAEVDPEWNDRGRHTAYFGEVNPNNNPETPAALFEVAFHATPADADYLRTPDVRLVATRAIAQGIAEYFAEADGIELVLPPEPPEALWMQNIGEGALEIGWDASVQPAHAGDEPTGYLVQTSPNGYGFDEGVLVEGTSTILEGYSAGDLVFARVIALNEGGHSLPSSVIGAGVAPSGNASVLVVDGYDRLDSGLLLESDYSAYDIDIVERVVLQKMNDFSYVARHGAAIGRAGFSFDSATDEAIEKGTASMIGYQAVDWYSGTDSSLGEPFPLEARTVVESYISDGGRFLASGSELGWALDNLGEADEQAFYREVLGAVYVADDVESGEAMLGGVLGTLGPLSFEDPSTYTPRFPDVLEPALGSEAAMLYDDGLESIAAVSWDDGNARGVTMGFPFETIDDADTRVAVMAAVLGFFGVVEEAGPDPEPEPGDDDGAGTDDGGDDGGTSGGGTDDGGTDVPADVALGDSGCGCRHHGGGRGGAGLVMLLGLLGWRRRRTG